jgi:hypothetical protein
LRLREGRVVGRHFATRNVVRTLLIQRHYLVHT